MTAPFGGSVTLPPGNSLTKSNYSFAGWNTMPDGSGTQYAPGSVISVSAGETLYATWSRNDFVVTFVTSNGTVADAPISVPAGDAITLTSPVNPIEPGYTFAGWFTAPTGGQLAGETGSSYLPVDSIVLYARWLASPEMILKFSANGGTGHVGSLSAHQGLTVVIPGGSGLLRPGFTFRGWSTTPRAGRPDVRIGAKLVLVHSRTLYALWHRVLPSTMPQVLLGSVGTFAPNSSVLTPTMRRFIASLAVGIDRHHRTTVLIYGYATSKDSSRGAQRLSLRRAQVVTAQLRGDLAHLKDVGVSLRASGEARLTNSVLASFRNVEVFAN